MRIANDPSSRIMKVLQLGPGLDESGGMSTVQAHLMALDLPGISISHVTTHRDGSVLGRLIVATGAFLTIFLVGWRYDLAHVHVSFGGSIWRKLIATCLLGIYRVPFVVHAHGSDFAEFWETLPEPGKWAIRWWLRRARRLLVLSQSWAKFYASLGVDPSRIVVIRNAVPVPAEPPPRALRPVANVIVICLGRLGERKGTWDLLPAFVDAQTGCGAGLILILAGDGEIERAKLWIAEHNCGETIKVLGWLGPKKRAELLERADILVLPSYREGLPMSVLEAQAVALPVIATPVGGIPEVVRDGIDGFLVPAGNRAALSDSLIKLAGDRELRLRLGKAGFERVKAEHSLERLAVDLRLAYMAALSG